MWHILVKLNGCVVSKKSDQRDELEDRRKSYLKKMRKLGEELSEIRRRRKKLGEKQSSYEDKLKKIDERIQGL